MFRELRQVSIHITCSKSGAFCENSQQLRGRRIVQAVLLRNLTDTVVDVDLFGRSRRLGDLDEHLTTTNLFAGHFPCHVLGVPLVVELHVGQTSTIGNLETQDVAEVSEGFLQLALFRPLCRGRTAASDLHDTNGAKVVPESTTLAAPECGIGAGSMHPRNVSLRPSCLLEEA